MLSSARHEAGSVFHLRDAAEQSDLPKLHAARAADERVRELVSAHGT